MNPYERNDQRGQAFIIDNRDGSVERIGAMGSAVIHADSKAYAAAATECADRNAREGWLRFVAITERAAHRMGVGRPNRRANCA